MPIERMRGTIRDLAALLEREMREIRLRNYERLAAILRRKEALVAECEEFLADAMLGSEAGELLTEFEQMRKKAEENATLLAAMRQGFADARARLEALHQSDSKSGLYAQGGGEIRARAPHGVGRHA
ncbi:MAG: hypothetical protein ACOZAA_15685 [Pseudomonadota bacterium]